MESDQTKIKKENVSSQGLLSPVRTFYGMQELPREGVQLSAILKYYRLKNM